MIPSYQNFIFVTKVVDCSSLNFESPISAYNPKSSDYVRKKYKQKLQKFEETCQLIRYLGDNMTVRYRAPNDRPGDFDNKLETFFALRGIEPTKTWMV